MPRFAYDLGHAARALRKAPLFSTVAIISLGLALALNTTIFALGDAVLHPYLPYPHPERIVIPGFRGGDPKHWLQWQDRFGAIRDGMQSYDLIASYTFLPSLVQTGTFVEDQNAVAVSPRFFEILGVPPLQGRTLGGADSGATTTQVAVISVRLWNRYFNARSVSDKLTLDIGRDRYIVVGVMPLGFHFPYETDIWIPNDAAPGDPQLIRSGPATVLRLKPNVSFEHARSELDIIAARLNARFQPERKISAWLERLTPSVPAREIFPSFILATVAMVLIIACANLGTMMIARGLARRRETAIRIAIGASRRDIVRDVLAECILIAAAGVALGMLLTAWALYAVPHLVIPSVPQVGDLRPTPSWRVFVFALTTSLTTTLVAAVAPAIQAARIDPAEPMKEGAGTTTGRIRDRYHPLIVLEVALSTTLLMCSALFLIVVIRLALFEFRYDAKRLVTTDVSFSRKYHPNGVDVTRVFTDLVDRARKLPHATNAATRQTTRPLAGVVYAEEGRSGERWMNLENYSVVSPEFLRTLGIAVVRGRDFAPGDATGPAPVVIVDEAAAARLWPDVSNPVGRMLKLGNKETPAPWLRVVGIAAALEYGPRKDNDLPPEPNIYVVVPNDSGRYRQLIVRGDGFDGDRGRATLAVELRRGIHTMLPAAAWVEVRPWLDSYENKRATSAFMATLFGAFAAFGLALCAVGLYGVLAYAVSRRIREFAVRIALGARRRDITRLVVHDAAVTALAGVGIGAFLALRITWVLNDAVSGMDYAYAMALIAAELILFGVSFFAALGPIRQAATADPVEVLRAA